MSGVHAGSGWDPVWEEIFRSREWGKYPPEHVIRFVARNFYRVPDRKNVRLLEVGCGPGANVWFMAREGFTVPRIDGSSIAIRQASERLSREGLAADLRVGDYSTIPCPDSSFDGVVENVSLYCNRWGVVRRALGEIRRILKPGAQFLSSFFSDRTWGYGRGTMVEPDGFIDITEGPLAGAGFVLFLNQARVYELFRDFADIAMERISWTMEGEQRLVEQFVITCQKPVS